MVKPPLNQADPTIAVPVEKQVKTKKRKPSDFRGCISKNTASAMLNSVEQSRKEWNRDI